MDTFSLATLFRQKDCHNNFGKQDVNQTARHEVARETSYSVLYVKLNGHSLQGREFESIYTNHRYTARELDVLSSHDSFDYLPGHSAVYRQWLQRQPSRLDWDRWLMMGLIGTTVGLVGFLLHQITHLLSDIKWHRTETLIQVSRFAIRFASIVYRVGRRARASCLIGRRPVATTDERPTENGDRTPLSSCIRRSFILRDKKKNTASA